MRPSELDPTAILRVVHDAVKQTFAALAENAQYLDAETRLDIADDFVTGLIAVTATTANEIVGESRCDLSVLTRMSTALLLQCIKPAPSNEMLDEGATRLLIGAALELIRDAKPPRPLAEAAHELLMTVAEVVNAASKCNCDTCRQERNEQAHNEQARGAQARNKHTPVN